jgi:uncharacterized protein (DUF1810 family)
MVKCEEYGKKLDILQRYHHPILGTRFLLCGKCFNKVNGDMERWSVFCRSDLFNKGSAMVDIQNAWNTNISDDHALQNWFNKLWIKLGSQ